MIYVMKKRLAQVLAVALVATSLGPTGLTASAATLMAEEADPKSDEGVMGQKDAATDAEEESGILTLAEENRADTSGICGKDGAGSMIWSLVDGVLTISGEGEMEDYGTDSGRGMDPWNWRYAVTTVCAALMLADAIMTLQSLDCWYERLSGNQVDTPIQSFYDRHFDNAYMEHRFQSMSIHPDDAVRGGK